MSALASLERQLQRTQAGRYCHGDAVRLADVCLASQVIGAVKFFQCDMRALPTVMRIYEECMRMEAFAQPLAAHQTIVTRPTSKFLRLTCEWACSRLQSLL